MKRHTVPAAAAAAALVLPLSFAGPANGGTATTNAPAAASAGSTQGTERAGPKRYERMVRVHTNKARKNHDRARLRGNTCVDRFADRWARKMARRHTLKHQNLRPIARRCNVGMVGENIAVGYKSGKAAVRGWMRSPGHRRNILRKPYRLLGVGVARDKHGHVWASQVFARR